MSAYQETSVKIDHIWLVYHNYGDEYGDTAAYIYISSQRPTPAQVIADLENMGETYVKAHNITICRPTIRIMEK